LYIVVNLYAIVGATCVYVKPATLYYFQFCGRHLGYRLFLTSAMAAGSIVVVFIVENIYIVFGTSCLSVTAVKLLLLPLSQPPS